MGSHCSSPSCCSGSDAEHHHGHDGVANFSPPSTGSGGANPVVPPVRRESSDSLSAILAGNRDAKKFHQRHANESSFGVISANAAHSQTTHRSIVTPVTGGRESSAFSASSSFAKAHASGAKSTTTKLRAGSFESILTVETNDTKTGVNASVEHFLRLLESQQSSLAAGSSESIGTPQVSADSTTTKTTDTAAAVVDEVACGDESFRISHPRLSCTLSPDMVEDAKKT